jgi:hypothetical protein
MLCLTVSLGVAINYFVGKMNLFFKNWASNRSRVLELSKYTNIKYQIRTEHNMQKLVHFHMKF